MTEPQETAVMSGSSTTEHKTTFRSAYDKIVAAGDIAKVSKKQQHWTKATAPATIVAGVASKVSVPQKLMDGLKVVKISSSGNKRNRVLTVSEDKCALFLTHQKVQKAGSAVAAVASSLPIPVWTPSKGFNLTSSESLRDRYVRYIDIADLTGVQTGVIGTQSLESVAGLSEVEDQIVTIWYNGNKRTVSLIVADQQERKDIEQTIDRLMAAYHAAKIWVGNDALLLRYIWYDIDSDRNGMISMKEFSNICNRINFYVKDPNGKFTDFRTEMGYARKQLTYAHCMTLLQSCKPQLPSYSLFEEIFGKVEKVDAKTFHRKFLAKQDKTATEEDAEVILGGLSWMELDGKNDEIKDGSLTAARFSAFLHSSWNDAFDPSMQEIDHDSLRHPLSCYWINTSHNTYLTGDQLRSKSSVEAYVRALQRGCKCLELDCWDGDMKDGKPIPVVYHGHTLTSKITFHDIIKVVNRYIVTHPDTMPIILSLENHCSHPFQREMAKSMKDLFGRRLYISTEEDMKEILPTPQSLRGKVMIKGKRPPKLAEKAEDAVEAVGVDAKLDKVPLSDSSDSDEYDEALEHKNDDVESKIVPELADLTVFHGTKFKDFDQSTAGPPGHMHSFSENKVSKKIGKNPSTTGQWRVYNREHMTRTYPSGVRVDSSNYNPIQAWSVGSQLVALNFQTADTPLILNDGRFRQNGNCGYVLKPPAVMEAAQASNEARKLLNVRVLSGSCIPKPEGAKTGETIDPFVQVELHDIKLGKNGKDEYKSTSFSTQTEDDNGFCPVWEAAERQFEVYRPSVAMLLFMLRDSDLLTSDFVAAAAIPVSCLRPGYRSVQLYDENNTRSGPFSCSTLLVEIRFDS